LVAESCVAFRVTSEKQQITRKKNPPPQPYYVTEIDAGHKTPDATRLLGFFVPIFHNAILIDAKRQKRRVEGI
jgi:hypothetical protein